MEQFPPDQIKCTFTRPLSPFCPILFQCFDDVQQEEYCFNLQSSAPNSKCAYYVCVRDKAHVFVLSTNKS